MSSGRRAGALALLATLVAVGSAPARAATPRILAYWDAYAVYDGRSLPRELPASRIDVLAADLARPSPGGRCTGDAELEAGRRFAAAESVDGRADTARPGALRGVLGQLRKLRRAHPRLRVVVVIAQLEPARDFARAAATPASRRAFVRSCIDRYVRGRLPGVAHPAPGIVDGFDLDWEVPRDAGQRRRFTLLAQEFRRQLGAVRPGLLLTAAMGATEYGLQGFDLPAAAAPLDWVNLMGYDIAGTWSPDTRFLAPLHRSPRAAIGGLAIADGVRAFIRAGVPRSKLLLGVPFYGLAYGGVAPGPRGDGLGQRFAGAAAVPGVDRASGAVPYSAIVDGAWAGIRTRHDTAAMEAWRYDADARTLVVYDDPASLRRKMAWARAARLGGAMMWEVSDDAPGHPLLRAMRAGLGRRP